MHQQQQHTKQQQQQHTKQQQQQRQRLDQLRDRKAAQGLRSASTF
jgi:hypothetical protein